jgi:hypothetical protein
MSEFQFPDPPPPNNQQRVPDDPPSPVPPYQPPPAYPQPSAPVPPGYASPSAPIPPQYQPPAYPQTSVPMPPQYQPPTYPYPSAPVPPQYQTPPSAPYPYVTLPPSHQVPPGYGYQAPPIQTSPVYPMPALPEPPKRRRGAIAIIAGALAVVLLVGAFGIVLALRNGGGDAQSVLNSAEHASLHDVTFKLSGNVGIGLSGTGVQLALNGNGKMTVNPLAMDVTISGSSLSSLGSSGNIEEILIGTDLYMNLGDTSGITSGKPWIKISLADVPGLSGLGSVLNTSNPFDYQHLHNVKLVGTDSINGRQASHLHATLSLQDSGLSPSDQATATAFEKQLGVTQSDITEDLWIFKDNSFPAKVKMHESITLKEASGGTTLSGTETTDETMTFTAWNSGVTISPPPADQVSDGTDLLPTPPAGS